MYLFTSLTSVLAWKRVYPRKFDALFRPGRRHPVQTQTPSVQSTAENLSCTGSLPEQKPASNLPSPLYPCCTKTTACLRELYSLTVLKSERFLYQKRYSWEVKLSIWWSENIQLPEDESSGSCILPGRSRQVLSAPFGKLGRFCPIYDFSSDNSAASRSSLQADTGVIRLQPYLRQTSLNFPKWEMLSFVQHLTVTEVKLVFSHIACSPEAIWEDRCK